MSVWELQNLKATLPEGKLLLGDSCAIDLTDECAIGTYDHLIMIALWDRQSEYTRNLFFKAYLTAFRVVINLPWPAIDHSPGNGL